MLEKKNKSAEENTLVRRKIIAVAPVDILIGAFSGFLSHLQGFMSSNQWPTLVRIKADTRSGIMC